MTAEKLDPKDPSDVQDYDADYTDYLTAMGESLGGVHVPTVTADTGITVQSSAYSAGIVKVWLSGGTAGQTYKVTVTLVTAGGRTKQSAFRVTVKDV